MVIADIDVNPENYEVRVDGELITCKAADELALTQKYFLFLILKVLLRLLF